METADDIVCDSPFVSNPSPDAMSGTVGGSGSSPFVWNQSAVPILWGLQIQSLPYFSGYWCVSK